MISGVVRALEGRLRLRIRSPGGRERQIEAVIDSGYSGWLTLPPTMIATLALPWQSFANATLADGSTRLFDVYEATVVWDRRLRQISVDELGTVPLVGMSLLSGYELTMQVRPGSKVRIKRPP